MNANNKNMQRNQYQKHHEIQEKISKNHDVDCNHALFGINSIMIRAD